MNIIAEIRSNIENWMNRKQRKVYKRMKRDNYWDYVYQLTLPDTNMVCTAVISLLRISLHPRELLVISNMDRNSGSRYDEPGVNRTFAQ